MTNAVSKFFNKPRHNSDPSQDESGEAVKRPRFQLFRRLQAKFEHEEGVLALGDDGISGDQEHPTQVPGEAAQEKLYSVYDKLKDTQNALHRSKDLISTLEAEKITWKQGKATLRLEKAALKADKDSLCAENAILGAENDNLAAENVVLRAEKNETDVENKILKTERNALRAGNDTLKAEIAALDAEKIMLQHSLTTQDEESEKLEAKVRAAQRRSFQTLESPHWMPDPTEHTTRSFLQIQDGIKRWSQKYANAETLQNALVHVDSRKRLLESIHEYVHLQDGNLPLELESESILKKTSIMLLSGLVSHRLFAALFSTPFFFGPEALQSNLSMILNGIQMGDFAGGHAWRCQMLRLLDPPVSVGSSCQKGREELKGLTRGLVTQAANKLTNEVIIAATGLLLTEFGAAQPKAHDELNKIANQAAELAYKLWTQKQHVELSGLACYRRASPGNLVFSACTEFLEEHPLHRHELDHDPQALDERDVGVVVSPSIILYGDAHAQDYSLETRNVLKRAVVWMESGPQPQLHDDVMEDIRVSEPCESMDVRRDWEG